MNFSCVTKIIILFSKMLIAFYTTKIMYIYIFMTFSTSCFLGVCVCVCFL